MVENSNYIEVGAKGVPGMMPGSQNYIDWWEEQKRRCLEGYSVGGKWMPGRLYFYINFWMIEMSKKSGGRKGLGFPFLRDTEWQFFPEFEICRGFSGLKDNIPEYNGDICGMELISGRGAGKTYWASSIAGYEYTFFPNSEILVTAHETKYSQPLMNKIKVGLNNIPGDIEINGIIYPSPFKHRRIKSDFRTEIRSGYMRRINGIDHYEGYDSRIIHRVYKDNHTAANGTRPIIHIFEEVGMHENLIESYNSSWECWMDGTVQFGSPLLIGTGGDMEKGTKDTEKMFYDPETYNLRSYKNTYDETEGKIGYFIPGWKGLNEFKDKEGKTDEKRAKTELIKRREKKKKGNDLKAFYQELQYQPFVPKEAFLVKTGNIFPIYLLQKRIEYLNNEVKSGLGQSGRLEWGMKGKVEWSPSDKLRPLKYPSKENDDLTGCIVIWEHPKEGAEVPYGLYVAGTDVVNQDEAYYSNSINSTFIYKRFISVDETYQTVVAEYSGRPKLVNEYFENVRKLLVYYNTQTLYDNSFKGLKQYLEVKGSLHLLKNQPSILEDIIPNSKVSRGYGVHFSGGKASVRSFGEQRALEWLLEEYDEGRTNVDKIFSIPLLQELIKYYTKGNFDRVDSFILCLLHDLDLHKHVVEYQENMETDLFFRQGYHNVDGKIIWA